MKRSYIPVILTVLLSLPIFSCRENWEEHYGTPPETVDRNVWEALVEDQDISLFVDKLIEFEYDTLFDSDNTYTLFIPVNHAFEQYLDTASVTETLLNYHISRYFLQSGTLSGQRRIQTSGEKYVLLEKINNVMRFDGIPLSFESPLYVNGKYFRLDHVAIPRPNLYEYIAATNTHIKRFIDSQDSIILDKAESIPIGIDDNGNTIYDTVALVINKFEEEYFHISEEFRSRTATMVFPSGKQYESALNSIASVLGDYQNHTEIPLDWQQEVLIPYLMEHGVFQNSLEPIEFVPSGLFGDTLKLKNILGDSIVIDYGVTNKQECSNGYAYNIADFQVPDTLYLGATRFEAEELLDRSGINKYIWVDGVTIDPVGQFPPKISAGKDFSNDSVMFVDLPLGYTGEFSLEFNVDNLFPRKYLMMVRTSYEKGGIFNVFLNDQLIREINYYNEIFTSYYTSVTGKYFEYDGSGYQFYDCWVEKENIEEYGKATFRFEYIDPANMPSNGLIIDYIDFIPYDE